MHQYVYVSKASEALSDQDIQEILISAREYNKANDITGVLIYLGDTFLQVLEGEPAVLNCLLDKISKDGRHKDFMMMADQPIEERAFAQWAMGYVNNRDDLPPQLVGAQGLLNYEQIQEDLAEKDGWVSDFLKQALNNLG